MDEQSRIQDAVEERSAAFVALLAGEAGAADRWVRACDECSRLQAELRPAGLPPIALHG